MSFLRALSSDSLGSLAGGGGGGSRSDSAAAHNSQNPTNSSSSSNQGPTFGTNSFTSHHATPSSSSSGKRHHAKALLHPMSLLLRRRSGQSNSGSHDGSSSSSYHNASSKFGSVRDLPDDFDPGIIYGTRQHDWSSPRRAVAPRQPSYTSSARPAQTASGTLVTDKSTFPSSPSPPRERQAFFREHFGDEPPLNRQEQDSQPSKAVISSSSRASYVPVSLQDQPFLGNDNLAAATGVSLVGATGGSMSASHIGDNHKNTNLYTLPSEKDGLDKTRQISEVLNVTKCPENEYSLNYDNQPMEHDEYKPEDDHVLTDDAPFVPLQFSNSNASRFSFEASSAADSLHNEEITLSENAMPKNTPRPPHIRGYSRSDAGSFDSEDLQSITSDDLRDDLDDDGFMAANVPISMPTAIPPPPGFENVATNALENVRQLQRIGLSQSSPDDELVPPAPIQGDSGPSTTSSLNGTNGSITGTEEDIEDVEDHDGCPPFVNPIGAGVPLINNLEWKDTVPGAHDGSGVRQIAPPTLPFSNQYQTASQGVGEYDSGSPSSVGGQGGNAILRINNHYESSGIDDYELDLDDEDDMIAEANREALMSDNDGWYGREFNFYPNSASESSYMAGGFFGMDLPKPGFMRNNPSLTPISERSESSLRNSLITINSNSFSTGGGISAGPLSAALLAELANGSQADREDISLSHLLSGAGWTEGHGNSVPFAPSSPASSISVNGTTNSNRPIRFSPILFPGGEGTQFPTSKSDEIHHSFGGDITTSYVQNEQSGWVIEKRLGGEVIERSPVHGAV